MFRLMEAVLMKIIRRNAYFNIWLIFAVIALEIYIKDNAMEIPVHVEKITSLVEHKGEYTGIREMRKHTAWYTAGYPHSSKLRAKVNEVESLAELEDLIQKL